MSATESGAEVSIVVVNFNSGAYLVRCLASIERHTDGLRVEVVVVDNASPIDQTAELEAAERAGARVVRQEHNGGYAGGCNRGLAESSGRIVLFLNADVLACEGTIARLSSFLDEHPEAGLVEPRTFLDDDRAFLIPEFFPLSPKELSLAALGRISGRTADRLSLRRVRRTLGSWRARAPREQGYLTGAFLAGRREVLEELGGFDEDFPLYYEDWDLFQRVRKSGRKLFLLPEAEAIHYAHRSVVTVWDESLAKGRVARALYLDKHFGRPARWLDAGWEKLIAAAGAIRAPRPRRRIVELGALASPPALELEGPPGPYLLEIALDPFFHLAAGHLGEGSEFAMSAETWRSLPAVPFYLRALELDALRARGAWSFQKT